MNSKGMVYLGGAGPGDAGLLTLRGAEVVGRAGVVVYDALVNPELLRLAPKMARTPGTKVVMMASERIGRIAELLVQHGMAPDTPAAMVHWGTTGRQRSVAGTLATIAERAARAKLSAPAVAVIGEVVTLRSK